MVSGIGSIALLPFLSEPVCTLFSNEIARVLHSEAKYMDDIQVEVKKRRVFMRFIIIIFSLLSTIGMPIWACVE